MLVPCVSYRSAFPRAWRFFARLRSIFAFAVASALIRCSIPRCFDSSDRRRKVIEMRRLPGEGTACLQVGPAARPSTRSADPRGIVKASSPDQSPFAPEISVHAGKITERYRINVMQQCQRVAAKRHAVMTAGETRGRTVAKDHRLSREQGDCAEWSAKLEVVNVWR